MRRYFGYTMFVVVLVVVGYAASAATPLNSSPLVCPTGGSNMVDNIDDLERISHELSNVMEQEVRKIKQLRGYRNTRHYVELWPGLVETCGCMAQYMVLAWSFPIPP